MCPYYWLLFETYLFYFGANRLYPKRIIFFFAQMGNSCTTRSKFLNFDGGSKLYLNEGLEESWWGSYPWKMCFMTILCGSIKEWSWFPYDVALFITARNVDQLENIGNPVLEQVSQWMHENGSQVAPQKSEVVVLTMQQVSVSESGLHTKWAPDFSEVFDEVYRWSS